MTLPGATTPDQSGAGSDGNKGVLRIPQSFSITGTSPSGCLVSYLGLSFGRLTPLQRCSRLSKKVVGLPLALWILEKEEGS